MGQFKADRRTILSVYPLARQEEQKHNGFTLYSLPAAEKSLIVIRQPFVYGHPVMDDVVTEVPTGEGYSLLHVYDTHQYVRDLYSDEERTIPLGIGADVVAQALVDIWGRSGWGAKAGFGPGVCVIENDTPTTAELERERSRTHAYLLWLISDADDRWTLGEAKNITDEHRRAAKWVGVDREWCKIIKANQTVKQCPACARDILGEALVCQHCHVNLVKFYEEMEIDPDPNKDAVVYNAVMRRRRPAVADERKQPLVAPSLRK